MNTTTDRIIVKETSQIYLEFLEKPIDEIITQFQKYKDERWESIDIDYDYDNTYYHLYKHRLENDKEYENRMKLIAKEEAAAEKRKVKRYEEYLRLKQEFEVE
ncbi:hypothetical protein b3_0177 [Synechococcus phage B3]|nr:hypothetical protein b3_0177 [Synechococcus phage B3]QGT54791.1 hypothetical protein b23_0176 [Synechococcus phage B23]